MKGGAYPEHVLCLVAARLTGRPVRWRDDRSDSFLGDAAGRDIHVDGELALDADGRILAMRLVGVANMGAYVSGVGPLPGSRNILKNGASLYRIPAAFVNMRCVLTNQSPVAAYRGAGRPDANLFTDRLVDRAARETGRDPVEMRRLNLVSPEELPYTAVSGQVYGEGDFAAVLDKAVAAADTAGFAARRAASEARGRVRGLGVASYLEATAPPGKELGGLRFEADGRIAFLTGTKDFGQGTKACSPRYWAPPWRILRPDRSDAGHSDGSSMAAAPAVRAPSWRAARRRSRRRTRSSKRAGPQRRTISKRR